MSIRRGTMTPWGPADDAKPLGEGIVAVSTPSHGGLYVPPELLDRIPQEFRQWAKSWSGSEGWYEEDCCWAAVAITFPHLFDAENVERAHRTLCACLL